ncbi:MAG TPA: hypothetical protein VH277_05770 [Gemmatimonadaceae bacterium]|jgi:hypothetical protein|nr:hypothetical protein [Gemmatimonadaceae bacterium]
MSGALRALLHGVIDYAGLFPPAALELRTAVREYETYRTSPDGWMLGRFVVAAGRLAELGDALDEIRVTGPGAWSIAALFGNDVAADVRLVREFNAASRNAIVDTLEGKATTEEDVVDAAAFARDELAVFVELPVANDPAALVEAVRRAGVNAKVRTGGVTADAFPAASHIVRFIRRCVDADVAFKATAGLHHPVRGKYRLTCAADAPQGMMYGYVNVFLAAAFMAQGMADEEATRLLEERDASAFRFLPDAVTWRDRSLAAEALASIRRRVVTSFGSCSFREPVDDLRSLGLLP